MLANKNSNDWMACPDCRTPYRRSRSGISDTWHCGFCHGEAVSWRMLRNLGGATSLQDWLQSKVSNARPLLRPCPYCYDKMDLVEAGVESFSLKIDICRKCEIVWFDSGELRRALKRPASPSTRKKDRPVPGSTELSVSMIDVGQSQSYDTLEVLEGLAGLPGVNASFKSVANPYITYSLILLLLLFQIPVNRNPTATIQEWGFLVSSPMRHLGITWITSSFIHQGLGHLFANLIFLFFFGGLLEMAIGQKAYLETLALSVLGAHLGFLLFPPEANAVVVGASGFIFGMMAFFCLRFPHSYISLPSFFGRHLTFFFVTLRVSAIKFFSFYVLINLLGYFVQTHLTKNPTFVPVSQGDNHGLTALLAACQMHTECAVLVELFKQLLSYFSVTSFAGHLGGGVGGLLAWLILDKPSFEAKSNLK